MTRIKNSAVAVKERYVVGVFFSSLYMRGLPYREYRAYFLAVGGDGRLYLSTGQGSYVGMHRHVAKELIASLLSHGGIIGSITAVGAGPAVLKIPTLIKEMIVHDSAVGTPHIIIEGKELRKISDVLCRYGGTKVLAENLVDILAVDINSYSPIDYERGRAALMKLVNTGRDGLSKLQPSILRDALLAIISILTDPSNVVSFKEGVGLLAYGIPLRDLNEVIDLERTFREFTNPLSQNFIETILKEANDQRLNRIKNLVLSVPKFHLAQSINNLVSIKSRKELSAFLVLTALTITNYEFVGDSVIIKEDSKQPLLDPILRYLGCRKRQEGYVCGIDTLVSNATTKLGNRDIPYYNVLRHVARMALMELGLLKKQGGDTVVDERALETVMSIDNDMYRLFHSVAGLAENGEFHTVEVANTHDSLAMKVRYRGVPLFISIIRHREPPIQRSVVIMPADTYNEWRSNNKLYIHTDIAVGKAVSWSIGERPKKKRRRVAVGLNTYVLTKKPKTAKKLIEFSKQSLGTHIGLVSSGEAIETLPIEVLNAYAHALVHSPHRDYIRYTFENMPGDKLAELFSPEGISNIATSMEGAGELLDLAFGFSKEPTKHILELSREIRYDSGIPFAKLLAHGIPKASDTVMYLALLNFVVRKLANAVVSGYRDGKVFITPLVVTESSTNFTIFAKRHGCVVNYGAIVCGLEALPKVLHDSENELPESVSLDDILDTVKASQGMDAVAFDIVRKIVEAVNKKKTVRIKAGDVIPRIDTLVSVLRGIAKTHSAYWKDKEFVNSIKEVVAILSILRAFFMENGAVQMITP